MAKIISIINNKGGVGKTATAIFLGELLAYLGAKVLEIDLDQQSNLSMTFNQYHEDSKEVIDGVVLPNRDEYNITELFRFRYRTKEEIMQLIKKTSIPNLDIIPSSKRHKHTPSNILQNTGNNNIILKKALMTITDEYDFILIDNAPASDILTVNSMFASDYVITPVRVEGYSYKGLKETLETIAYIKDEHDLENVKFLGTFLAQVKTNTVIFRDYREAYAEELDSQFFKTPIREDIKVQEIGSVFESVLTYCPNTNAVFDYAELLLETGLLDAEKQEMLKQAIGVDNHRE